MSNYLFIGGPNDGKWMQIEKPRRVMYCVETIKFDAKELINPPSITDTLHYREIAYHLESFCGLEFYIVKGMPPVEAFRLLLTHYRPNPLGTTTP